jgi:hypothetical protein
VDLLVVLPVAVLTLVLCDLTGGIARAKGRSYWLFFAFGLLLWFPALITALLLPARAQPAEVAAPRRLERVLAGVLVALGAVAAGAGLVAAVAFAP